MVHHNPFGKSAGAHRLLDRYSVSRTDGALLVQRKAGLAHHLTALLAIVTFTTIPNKRNHDMIAGFHLCHALANPRDDSGGFMSEYRGEFAAPMALSKSNIGVANRAGFYRHFYLVGIGVCQLDVFDNQWLAKGMTDGCFHSEICSLKNFMGEVAETRLGGNV